MRKKAAFYTLGCKVNFCETESLKVLFEQSGYRTVAFDQAADLYVINTCTVTAYADHKSRKAIRRARKLSKDAVIVVTGCYAQTSPESLSDMEEVDLVVGTRQRDSLPGLVRSLNSGESVENLVEAHKSGDGFEILPAAGRRGRTRGFIKIQEGCNQCCSYCIVPRARGGPRSMPPEEVLNRAEMLVQSGCRELVLTGIHLGIYGSEQEDLTLAMLLRELEKLPGLLRLRLSSLEPSDITPELVEVLTYSKVICPHLHIPLQSGDGEVLRRMNRPYNSSEFLYLAKWLKQQITGLALSSDVIVGFPGETERHHRRSMALIKDIGFSRLHVFKFSARPGTVAAGLPDQLPNLIKEERSREMIALGEEMSEQYRRLFLGTVQPILVEKVVPHQYGEGLTPHYLRARIMTPIKGLHWRGKIIKASLTGEADGMMSAVKAR